MKFYQFADSNNQTTTLNAVQALQWHRDGHDVIVYNAPWDPDDVPVRVHGIHQDTNQEKTDRENREHCKRIAMDLDDYASGRVYRCPDCDSIITLPDDVGDKFRCPDCGTVYDVDDLEQLSVADMLDDVYDVEYTISGAMEYRGVCLMIACGGPNIYVDTNTKNVELYWWGDRASYPLSDDAIVEIDNYFCDFYDCARRV